MRVLVISDYRDSQAARPEAELILGLKREGVDLDVITYPDTIYESRFRNAGIAVTTNHPANKYDRDFIKYLKNKCREEAYDIFYLFNSQAIINGIFAAYDLKVKVVLYRGYTGNIHWYDPTAYFKYLNPRVDKVVCLADSIKDLLQQQKWFEANKAITINKGHHPDWYKNITPINRSDINLPSDAFVVACMGNARTFKGIRYLLEATYLLNEMPTLHILLIGRDMNKGHLNQLIKKSPLSKNIHVTGWRIDVLAILSSCDVFMLPSIGGEATTKSVIEAMSMGLPPIITDIYGNKGLVLHQENGLVVPTKSPQAIADAIFFYYTHRDLAKDHGQLAKRHISEKFHIERTVRETRALFQDLVAMKSQDHS